MNSWKVSVLADNSGKYVSNALRFKPDEKEKAEAYGLDLASRWTLVRDWKIEESEDEPNR